MNICFLETNFGTRIGNTGIDPCTAGFATLTPRFDEPAAGTTKTRSHGNN